MLAYLVPLVIDTLYSWARMFVALFLSILIALGVGIYAAINRKAEKVIIPIVDILQTLPILAFFPFVIYIIVATIPGYIGINAAVVFLIITSMLWNIIFGVYEAVKTLPNEFMELAALYGMGIREKLSKILIPASMPKVVEQSMLSWSIGLFYLVTSEIFSTSNASYAVKHGIGVALTNLAFSGNFAEYAAGIGIFIVFVIATREFFFVPFEKYVNRYNQATGAPIILKASSRIRKLKVVRRLFQHISTLHNIVPKHKPHIFHYTASAYIPQAAQKNTKIANAAYIAIFLAIALIIITNSTLAKDEVATLYALLASFARVWLAFLVIVLVAIPLGVYLIFLTKHTGKYMLIFQVVAAIPATILLPIIVIAVKGLPAGSELTAFIVYFLSGIWYVVFSIMAQKPYISQSVFELKKLFEVKGIKAWKKIYIYAILPGLITGAVTGIAAEWNASIVAEYFTTTAIGNGQVITSVGIGIGKLLDISLSSGNMTLMLLGLINLTIMIVLVNRFVWKRFYDKVENVYK